MADLTLANMYYSPVRDIPLGALYVTAVLEKAGFEVDFKDYQATKHDNPYRIQLFKRFLEESEDTLAIGCTSDLLPFVIHALEEIKASEPEKKIILGGPGPSCAPEKLLESFPFIDVVVRGEAEQTMLQLMKAVKTSSYSGVKGIAYRKGSSVLSNPDRDRITDLDSLPLPAYHQINPADYEEFHFVTSRGCMYPCTFCEVTPFWKSQIIERNLKNVFMELELLSKDFGIGKITVSDDTFMLKRERVMEFCEKMNKLEMEWSCFGRVDLMDVGLMRAMEKAGCTSVYYGVESGSDKVLEKIRKGFTIETALDRLFESVAFFDSIASFIWGFPFESAHDLQKTLEAIDFVRELGGHSQLHFLAPSQLSQIYSEYKGSLEFSELLQSDMGRGFLASGPDKPLISTLITSYPEVFAAFYYYPSPDFSEKLNIVREFSEKHLQSVQEAEAANSQE